MTKKARINQQMGQNNQKDQKGPKMTVAVMLVQNNQKIWSPHISHTILKVRFFLGHPVIQYLNTQNAKTEVSIFWHIHLALNPPILAIEEAAPPFYPDPRLRCEYTTSSLNLADKFHYRYPGLQNLWQSGCDEMERE